MSDRPLISSPFYSVPQSVSAPGATLIRNIGASAVLGALVCLICTQYVASQLGYASVLGEPWLTLGPWKLYMPFDWLAWHHKWYAVTSPVVRGAFRVALCISGLGILAIAAVIAYLVKSDRESLAKQSESLHGSAHWASPAEVQRTGLIGAGKGVYVGAWKNPRTQQIRYLRHDGPEHIMAFAPTRSGKGVGLVLPTLLSWPHSAVIYDIKGENWALTSGWRRTEANNVVLKFEPAAADGSSARFNPLAEVRVGTEREVADVQNIMTMIVDPEGKGLQDHWQKSAQALLVGVALHVLYAENNKTLNGIVQFLSNPARTVAKTMAFMLDTDHDMTGPGWPNPDGSPNYCHPVVAAAARDMLNKADEEQSSVLSSAIAYLTLYRDPLVSRNTSACDFRVSDLMNHDKPVSLYLVVPPSDKDRLRPLIRLVINQIVRGLTEKMEFEGGRSVAGYKHRLLLMLDEFPSLGKLDVFQESLAFIAGYGLKAYLIIQDISQLWTAYGKDESIFSNCHVRVAYAPNKVETAELLSKMTGTATIVKRSFSKSGGLLGAKSNVTASTQETQRALLTADEVMRLPAARKDTRGNIVEPGDMLVFMAGQTPIYGKQILYFLDPTFSARARIAAPRRSEAVPGAESSNVAAAGPMPRMASAPAAVPGGVAIAPAPSPVAPGPAVPSGEPVTIPAPAPQSAGT